MINKRRITLPVVYSRPFASKAIFFERYEIEEYYKSFLTSKVPPGDHENVNKSFNSFVESLENPKLSKDEQQELENDLSKEELLKVSKIIKLQEKMVSLKSSMKLFSIL